MNDVLSRKKERDLSIPTKEELLSQLEEHFGNKESKETILKLLESIYYDFLQLQNAPYRGFAVYVPEKPCLTITHYATAYKMVTRERYPADYSALTIRTVCNGKYQITVIHAVKRISLAYVK